MAGARFTLTTPAGEIERVAAAPRPLQRLQRDRGGRLLPAARGRAGPGRAGPRVLRGRVRPRGADRRSAAASWRSCWSRTPPARTRCSARSRCADGERRARRAGSSSTTASPTAATSRGSGTPTSRRSPPRAARVVCSGTRAEELALRLKYAGVAPAAARGRPALERGSRPRAGRPAERPALRAPHLHRPARAARRARRPRLRAAVLGMTERRDLARHRVRLLRRRPAAVGRAGRRSAGRRCSTSAAGPAASRSASRRRGHRVTGLDLDPGLLEEVGAARAARWSVDLDTVAADARYVRPRAPLRPRPRPDAARAALPRCGGAHRDAGTRSRASAARRHVRGRADGPRGRVVGDDYVPPGPTCATSTAGCTRASPSRCACSTAARRSSLDRVRTIVVSRRRAHD